jgi:CheY-like chemotaxis protein
MGDRLGKKPIQNSGRTHLRFNFGYTLMQQIRALPPQQGGQIPTIALTAYAGELDQQQALKAGFQQHLIKPIEPDELVRVVATLMDNLE